MIEYKSIKAYKKEPILKQCDICNSKYSCDSDSDPHEQMESHCFVHIDFIGGYASEFGDEMHVKLDMCQKCFIDKVGEFCYVKQTGYSNDGISDDWKRYDKFGSAIKKIT